jgi:hypothetical protein
MPFVPFMLFMPLLFRKHALDGSRPILAPSQDPDTLPPYPLGLTPLSPGGQL